MARGLDDLKIYQMAEKLELQIYEETKNFPLDEKYRSIDQLRRASASVSDNIAEGYGRFSFGDKINRFYIARGEVEETKRGIEMAYKKGFVREELANQLLEDYTELIKGINGYIKFLYRQKNEKEFNPQAPKPKAPKRLSTSFTLVELIVSLGIIIVVVVSAVGIYVYTLGGQQKSVATVNLQEDGQYLLSMIAKDARNNWLDYDYYPDGMVDTPDDELALVNDPDSPQTYYVYRYDASGRQVEKCQNSGYACDPSDPAHFIGLTMTDVKVEKLDFYIEPISNPYTQGATNIDPPRVTTVLELRSEKERIGEKRLKLQQTIHQRREEKK